MWTSYLFWSSGSSRPTCSPHSWGWTGCKVLRRGGWSRWLCWCCGLHPVRCPAGAAWSAAGRPAGWTWESGLRWTPIAYAAADTQENVRVRNKIHSLTSVKEKNMTIRGRLNTHISFLLEIFLYAQSDPFKSCLPFFWGLVQLTLQLLNVL